MNNIRLLAESWSYGVITWLNEVKGNYYRPVFWDMLETYCNSNQYDPKYEARPIKDSLKFTEKELHYFLRNYV